jgi:hypothetical protein
MEDKVEDIILFAILIVVFAMAVGLYKETGDVTFEQHITQPDNIFNKWRRIY